MTDTPDAGEPDAGSLAGAAATDDAALIPSNSGLCRQCRHARAIVSGRGSRFVLCQRSRTEPRFPRYPPLPILACAGFESR